MRAALWILVPLAFLALCGLLVVHALSGANFI